MYANKALDEAMENLRNGSQVVLVILGIDGLSCIVNVETVSTDMKNGFETMNKRLE